MCADGEERCTIKVGIFLTREQFAELEAVAGNGEVAVDMLLANTFHAAVMRRLENTGGEAGK